MAIYTPENRAPAGPKALVRSAIVHRDLVWQMARREVVGRYKGSVLGLMWSFFYPLLMLGAYTFAFGYVLGANRSIPNFALYVFSGLVLASLFNDVVTRAPGFILQNTNYVKKVVFPLEVFPWVHLVSAMIHAGIMLVVLLAALLVVHRALPATALLSPLAVAPLALMILGLAWLLSALGVYLRDVGQTIGIIAMMLMYLSPMFYKLENIDSPAIRMALRANPLTIPLVNFRRTLLEGVMPEWGWLAGYCLVSMLAACAGFYFFQRTRRGFADVI